MQIKHLLVVLSLTVSSAFAQTRIHPDLNVPKIDLTEFERHQDQIRQALEEIDFNQEGKVEALSVTVPDYKPAHAAFVKNVTSITTAYDEAMTKLQAAAEKGAEDLKKLQGTYSSRLLALETSIKQYPESADTFKKSLAIEKSRMRIDLDQQYANLLNFLQASYNSALGSALQSSGASGMQTHKPNVLDRVASVALTPVMAVTAAAFWVAPFPGLAPNFWPMILNGGGDEVGMYADGVTYWGVLKPAHDAISYKTKKEAYKATVAQYAEVLFRDCKTASCVFELSKDHKKFINKMMELNQEVQIGDATLGAQAAMKSKSMVKILKDAADLAASTRPTAIYVNP